MARTTQRVLGVRGRCNAGELDNALTSWTAQWTACIALRPAGSLVERAPGGEQRRLRPARGPTAAISSWNIRSARRGTTGTTGPTGEIFSSWFPNISATPRSSCCVRPTPRVPGISGRRFGRSCGRPSPRRRRLRRRLRTRSPATQNISNEVLGGYVNGVCERRRHNTVRRLRRAVVYASRRRDSTETIILFAHTLRGPSGRLCATEPWNSSRISSKDVFLRSIFFFSLSLSHSLSTHFVYLSGSHEHLLRIPIAPVR